MRALLTALGVVAVATGAVGVLTGVDGMPGDQPGSSTVESELRFLYVFWIGFGAAALYLAPRASAQPVAVRALAALLFAGGVARGIAWIAEGRPDDLFVVLMALELLIPPVILLLQRSLSSHIPDEQV